MTPNKTLVTTFLDLAFNQHQPEQAATQYLGATYRQHNPMAADGPAAFVAFVRWFSHTHPALRLETKRVLAEGDMVAVHGHLIREPGDRGVAVIDLFRVEDGKIVEHWDVLQDVPEKSANDNTMF
jgi:predicted SnoaL-like aldol condensation-catalyzing enzyme